MVETTMTAGLLAGAAEAVTPFGGLVLLVLGLGLGVFVVNFIMGKVKAARRG